MVLATYLMREARLKTVALAGSCSGIRRAEAKIVQCAISIRTLEMPDIRTDSGFLEERKIFQLQRSRCGESHIATRPLTE